MSISKETAAMELADVVICMATSVVALLTAFAVVVILYYRRQHSRFAHIPGPPRDSFIFGNIPTIRKRRLKKGSLLADTLLEWSRQYGDTFVVYFLARPVIFTVEPGSIKEVLVTGHHNKPADSEKNIGYLFGERFIGSGLVLQPDDNKWARCRMVFNPTFHRRFLRNIMEKFNEVGDQLMEKLNRAADGKTVVDMAKEFHRATLDVIGKASFGEDLQTLEDDTSPFPDAISSTLVGLSTKMKDPLLQLKFWKQKELKDKVRKACLLLRNTGKTWLQQRREAIARGETVPDDILTVIIRAQDQDETIMSEEEALDNIVTFFVAGQETTANTLSFLLYELTQKPHVIAKMHQEIKSMLGDRTDVKFEDVSKLEYMTMAIKEALRLYPPAALLYRQLGADIVVDGYEVPKGTFIVLSSFVSGRHPKLHPDPEEFKPERFHPDCEYRPSMYTYFPFSLGPRNCIGQNFAQIEAKVFLVKLLQMFDFSLVPGYEFKVIEKTTLQPANGVPCTLTHRQ